MSEEMTKKRVRRTAQQRAEDMIGEIAHLEEVLEKQTEKKRAAMEEFDARIASTQKKIRALQKKRADLLNPKSKQRTKRQKIQDLVKQAQKSGLKPDEIAARLGLPTEE